MRRDLILAALLAVLLSLLACQSGLPPPPVPLPEHLQVKALAGQKLYQDGMGHEASSAERQTLLRAALQKFQEVLAERPEDAEIRLQEQDILLEIDPLESRRRYHEDSRARGKRSRLDLVLTARYHMVEEPDRAEEILNQVLVEHPDFALAHHALAFLRYTRGDYPQALEQVSEALRLDPSLFRAWRLQAELQDREGERELALETYKTLLDHRDDPDLRQRYARVLLQSQDPREARKAEGQLRRVLAELTEEEAHKDLRRDAFYDLGIALLQQGQAEPALRNFRQALAIDPSLLTAYYAIGWVQEQLLHDDAAALESYEQYIRKSDQQIGAKSTVVWLDSWVFADEKIRRLRERVHGRGGASAATSDAPTPQPSRDEP